jgi:hypothetical protein
MKKLIILTLSKAKRKDLLSPELATALEQKEKAGPSLRSG